MAKLSRALHTGFPKYYGYFKTKAYTYKGAVHANHNKLLGPLKNAPHIKVDGIKTGFVNASGFNLAASGVSGDRRLIVVVMGGTTGKSRDHEVANLMREYFKKTSPRGDDEEEYVIDSEDLPDLEMAAMDDLIVKNVKVNYPHKKNKVVQVYKVGKKHSPYLKSKTNPKSAKKVVKQKKIIKKAPIKKIVKKKIRQAPRKKVVNSKNTKKKTPKK
jgi:D-alanyl-D-alanine carboxypeptidase